MMRHRLTITLKDSVLKTVDRAVDGVKIRNRSHAIEYLIEQTASPTVNCALILAGGKGVKPTPLSKEMPKALLPVNDKPVLQYTIEKCAKHNIKNIYISIGPEGKEIHQNFGDGTIFGVHITYLKQQKSNIGTAPSLLQAAKVIPKEPFMLIYGDVLAEINFSDFINFHLANNNFATMALTSVGKTADWGVVKLHGTRINKFTEKPKEGSTNSYVINAGMYIFQPEIFKYITAKSTRLEQDLFPKLADESMLSGYLFDGRWYDVGSLAMYHQVTKEHFLN